MSQFIFNNDSELGGAIEAKTVFCALRKDMPEVTYEMVMGNFRDPLMPGLVGNKWSKLFGFTFRPKNIKRQTSAPIFQIVYCPKQSNNLVRNGNALHGWYLWEHFRKDLKKVSDIEKIYNDYGFNANKFFHSDYFEQMVNIFVKNCQYVMNHQMKPLLDKYKLDHRFTHTVHNLTTSIDINRVLEVQKVRTIDLGNGNIVQHAKIGYNADKTYDLYNLDTGKKSEKVKSHGTSPVQPDEKIPSGDSPEYIASHTTYDQSMKHKFGGGRDPKKVDKKVFDKYDDMADDVRIDENEYDIKFNKIFDKMIKEALSKKNKFYM